ncbi:aldo/keto reductase [Mycobacterium intracellulare]|uniref:Aldo/keto reductase n=1 Tax=Mycobacterium intracellulare TaxID=1767 RepID=A0AAE4RMM3_MYCIT|nr:aldo/keto reductase [Mycobacterium intracellulare]MDV6980031.1 aldo/keto reductase [Mycobacterium intracellulare]MDV6985588.1 aldo/keto reductase [Mycobacterium intracellulare]MDV7015816.1 aldo/keto reductase [Mycobacterium intracellulare]MDV7030636.1 aldo/keto reductase [Mycobacterium intracellulare]
MSTTSQLSAGAAGTFTLGTDLTVHRLGYGTMQLPGPGVWGPPADRDEAIAVLRHTVELGINLIDTADAYGPFVTDELIRAALHPYPDELVIATKVGFTRQGPDKWAPVGRPEYLRQQTELNLRHLKVDRLDLLQLHRIDTAVALEDQVGVLKALQDEGKVRHIGLSEVSVDEMKAARKVADIVSVQNQFNFSNRSAEPLLDYCETEGIGFIPWTPLATGDLAGPGTPLAAMAPERHHSPSQLVLAWLLKRSPAMLPIPGTSSIKHLEDNIAAANIQLSADEFDTLNSAA